ncbi:MFS transporter [Micromonospora parva]|uniref:MFS transporter n=1 Tax=Micromonospora parva TaxID=1464048 RepID=UPI0033DD639F
MNAPLDIADVPRTRPPEVWRRYFGAYLLSAVGTGMWIPLQGIFLHEYRHVPVGQLGGYFAVMALAAVAINLPIGPVADRHGPLVFFVTAGVLQGVGMLLVAVDRGIWPLLVAGCLSGLGNGMFFAVQTPVLMRLVGPEHLSATFGRQYQLMNVGGVVGALLGGAVVHLLDYPGYLLIIAANAASTVLHVCNVALILPRAPIPTADPDRSDPTSRTPARRGLLAPLRDRAFLPLVVLQLGLVVFGAAQMDTVAPVVFQASAGLPVWMVTVFIVANCLVVVVTQGSANRWVARRGYQEGIFGALACWLVAFLFALSVMVFDQWIWQVVGVAACAAVFGVGETLLAPSLQPLVVQRAPADRLAAYSSAMSLSFSVGIIVAPALGLWAVDHVDGWLYWLIIAIGTATCLPLARMGRSPQNPDVSELSYER